jgi:hypothetical protein
MSNNVNGYLANLERQAEANYEAYEEYGRPAHRPAPRTHALSHRPAQRISSVTGTRYSPKPDVRWQTNTQALVDIVVTRLSANLVGVDLPFAILGFTHLATQYFGMITPPSDLSFSVDTSNPTRLDFVWTNGILTDRVRVTTTQNNYVAFLQGLASDMFMVSKVRMTLSDTTNIDQFNRSVELGEKTMFGKRTFVPIPVQSLKSPHQFQTNIIDLGTDEKPLKWGVDKNVVLLSQIKAVAGFSNTFSTFISNLERLNYSML